MFKKLRHQFEEFLATVRSESRVDAMRKRQLTQLANWLEEKSTSSSSDNWVRDIIEDGDEFNFSISLLKDAYQVAKGSDSLRKETVQMLGSLMLNPNFLSEDIEYLLDDLESFFSSMSYPRLSNEDDFFYKMEEAFMFPGTYENGLPAAEKKKLLLLVDLPMLSYSSTRIVEDPYLENPWGPPVLSELRLREFVCPKREYKDEPLFVIVNSERLQDYTFRSEITKLFKDKPDTKCILNVSGFLDSGKLLSGKLKGLPSSVRHLSFVNGSCCTEIGDKFLKDHPSLETADFSCLQCVVRIGRKFLSGCKSLTSVYLPEGLQMAGYKTLKYCDSLEVIDVSKYKIVVTEADTRYGVAHSEITDLLEEKPGTECVLDMSGFLDESGEFLTSKLEGLLLSVRHLSFTNGSCCTAIGDDFLKEHRSLISVDFSSLRSASVTSIGNFFLSGCTSLEFVDLSVFLEVARINDSFLRGCLSLKTIPGLSFLKKVKIIGKFFLFECSALKSVDLSAFSEITEINDDFLCKCSSLETVSNLSELKKVTRVGRAFFLECSSLGSVDLSGFSKVTEVEKYFMLRCSSLKTISNVSGLRRVVNVGEFFLKGCSSLAPIDASEYECFSVEMKKVFEGLNKVLCYNSNRSQNKQEALPIYRVYDPSTGELR